MLRRIPGVDTLLQEPDTVTLCLQYGRQSVIAVIREEVKRVRKEILNCKTREEEKLFSWN